MENSALSGVSIASYEIDATSKTNFDNVGGLTLNTTTGAVTGTPNNGGMYSIMVNGLNAAGTKVASGSLMIMVNYPSFYYNYLEPVLIGSTINHQIISTSLPTTSKSFVLTTSSKAILDSTGGITFNETTGVFSGKPTKLGSYYFQVNALNADAKMVGNAFTFINVSLPTFGYTVTGNIIKGNAFSAKPENAPSAIASYKLEEQDQKILTSIGGLEFNTKDGVISGKPLNLGYYSFQISGLDASGNKVAKSSIFVYVTLPSFEYTTTSNNGLGLALIGSSYTAKVLLPFTGVVTYAIDSSSASSFASLEGFTLDSKTGTITGIGTKEVNANIFVNGIDASGNVIAKSQQFITVKFPWFIYNISAPLIIDSSINLSISQPPTKAKTYSLDASTEAIFKSIGTLSLNTSTGAISGVPKKLGFYMFIVNAYDDYSKLIASANVSVQVSLPIFSYNIPQAAIVNQPLTLNIKNKPAQAKTFVIDQNSLSNFNKIGGLSFNATTGVISGSPEKLGGSGFIVYAKDENGNNIGTSNPFIYVSMPIFLYTVNDSAAGTIAVDSSFITTIKVAPEKAVRYTIDSMYLDRFAQIEGLEFNGKTGVISGKPKKMGYHYFKVNAYDINSQAIATANISLKITYPQFKYKAGYEKGVVDADYSAQVLNPLPNAVSYTIDTNYFKIFTTAGFQFNKNDGSISGRPKRNGYVYLDILANDINNKPIGTASILIFIKKASTISVTNSTPSYNYNNKPQGPSNTTTTGSSGTVTFNYKGIDNDYNASSLPTNAGEYSAIATIAEDSNYFYASSAPVKFKIQKAPLVITATEQLKKFGTALNNTNAAPSILYKVDGVVDGQTVTGITIEADNIAQNPKSPAGSKYTLTPSAAIGAGGFISSNYDINYVPYVGTVQKQKLVVTATGPNKQFGSPLTSEVSNKNFTATGMLDGEVVTTVTLTPDANGLSAASLAGSTYKVTPSLAIGSGGFLASNYDVTYVPFDGTIGKRELIITATGPSKTYGTTLKTENNILDISFKGLGSGETITEILLTPDANGQSATLAAGEKYTITPSGAKGTLGDLATNYNITYVPFTGTVTKKSLTITAGAINKSYGTALSNSTTTSNFKTTSLVGSEAITEVSLTPDNNALSATTAAGASFMITPSNAKGTGGFIETNYDITYLSFVGKVSKSNVSLSITGNATYAYNGTAVGPTTTNLGSTDIIFTYTGIAPTVYASNTAPIQAGNYQVVAKLKSSDNVNETISSAYTFKIEKGVSTVSVTGNQAFTYNGKFQGPATSTVVGSTEKIVYTYSGVSPTVYAASTIAPKNAGTYQVIASVAADNNFEAATSSAYTFTISKANLKVTADSKSKTLNLPLPKLSKFFTGFAQEDDSTSLTTQPVITTTATATSPLGDYPITVSGGSSANYNLSYEAGVLTIDLKLDPTISLSDVRTSGAQAEVGTNGNGIKSNSVNSFNYVTRNSYTSNKNYGDAPFTLSASSNSNGSFTFRSHNTNVITISGNVVTIVGAGTALIEVIQGAGKASTGSDEFHEGNAAATVVVSKASSTIVVTGNTSYAYSSNIQGPSTATVVGSNGQVTYNYLGTGATTYSSSNRPSAIGTYNVTASVASNENYNAAVSDPFSFEIAKANSTITVKGLTSYVYNGTPQGTNSSVVSGSNGSITYSYKGTGSTSYGPSATQPTTAGTYDVTATVAENENYKSATSDPFSFTITKENSTIFAIGDKNYTYKGSAQGPSNTTGVTGSTGAISFSYQGTGSTSYGPSATAPANSGTYQVIATVASDVNYNAASSPIFEFTITKASVDLRITGNTSYTYIAAAQGPNTTNLSGSSTAITFAYTGINGTTYGPSATRPGSVGTYNVVATATEDANQFGATSDVYEFTIIKAASSISVLGTAAYVYNESAQGPNDKNITGSTGLVTYSYSGTGNTTYTASATAPMTVGTYQVIATVVSDENYNGASSSPFSFAITKANSTVTVVGDASYTYSGAAQGPNANTHTGSLATVTYNYSGAGSTIYASSATAPTNAGTYKVIATLPGDDNNNTATSDVFEFAITKANPSVLVNGLTVFEYTGKAQGPNDAIVVGSTGTLSYSYVGRGATVYTSSKTAPKNAGDYQVIASITADNNYNAISSDPYNFSIIKKELVVTALDVSKTLNYPNPIFNLEYSGFVAGEDENNLATLPIATTEATTTSTVGDYTISVDGGVSTNYEFRYIIGTLTIDTKLTPEITLSNVNKTYGDASFAINATSNSQGGFTYRSSNTNVATISGNNVTIVGAGTTSIIVNQAADVPNNFLPSSTTASLIVVKAPLTITASNKTKVYGASNPALTVTYDGFKGTDDASILTTAPTLSTIATNTSAVGTYTITASNAAADNYTISYVNGSLSVTKAPLTITATEVSKTYGSSLVVINNADKFTVTTTVTGESVTSVILTPDTDAAAATTAAGASYQMTPSAAAGTGGFDAANYEITYVPYTGVVAKKALTITATGPNKVYGSAIATTANATQFTSVGLVTGETIAGVTLTPNTAGSAATTSAGVAYTVTPSLPTGANGFIAANYNITYVPFEGSVSKKALTATADNKSKIYGATNPAFTITYDGFVNNDDAAVLTLAPVASTSATATSNVGTYDIAISNGTAANYTLTAVKGTLTINKATLTVTAENKSRIYGASNPTLTYTYAGFVNDQTASSLSTAPTASTTAKNTSKVGDYDITLSGAADNNYEFVYNKGILTVNKATLTVTAQNNERCFAANDPALSYIVLGFANGEDTTVFSSQIKMKTNTSASTAAGDYKTIAYDAAAENYTFEFIDGVFIVRPLPTGSITSTVDYVCDGANLLLTTSGAAKYVWYKDGVAVANASTSSLTITSKGDYKAKLISTYGCEAMSTNTLAIKQYFAPVANFDYQYYCVDKPVNTTNKSVFTTSGPVKFVWDNGAGVTSAATNPTFTYNTIGNKTIKLSVVPDFCPALKNEVSKVVPIEAPKPAVRLPLVDAITSDATQLQARTNVGITYEWSPMVYWANSYQVPNPTVMITKETLFNIKMTAASSCVTVDTLQVRAFNKRTVYLPNTFTPNGDGVNDIFKINPVGIRELRYFRIINQWGVRIFETTNLSEGWDGRLNGVREPLSSYTWIVEAVDTNGQPVRESGTVTLIR
jgi:gliding motility-associated-like protein